MSDGAEELKAIDAQGVVIKELKTAKADKAEIDAAVAKLLEAKAAYKAATGKDHVGAGKGSSKKDKKPKAEKAPAGPTKKELRMAAKAAKAKEDAAKKAAAAEELMASGEAPYGDYGIIDSRVITDKSWCDVGSLRAGGATWVRGHVQNVRMAGKMCFMLIRQSHATVQAVLFQSKDVTKEMVAFAGSIPKESVIDIYGVIAAPKDPIASASMKTVEVAVSKLFIVSKAVPELPFQVEDAARRQDLLDELNEDGTKKYVSVALDTRLNTRTLDTRTPANQGILRVISGVGELFREFLVGNHFTEIHTPKLIAGASEGGADIFTLKYFGRDACLAQSPQLYKQMACANAGLERVFETGPVFRAENSNTYRHMCEFTGADFEMVIKEHYYEALEMFSDLFIHIFEGLNERFAPELAAVNEQFPFEPLVFCKPALKLTFAEGMALLRESGMEGVDDMADPSTEQERILGRIVKEKYGTDFFMMDKYPMSARPFYTMPDPENPDISNSYDFFIRGNEILSGAQRIHDYDLLIQEATKKGIPVETLKDYCDSFKFGSQPHAGGGIGLDRVVMLFLDLDNIRKACLFSRDPKRLTP